MVLGCFSDRHDGNRPTSVLEDRTRHGPGEQSCDDAALVATALQDGRITAADIAALRAADHGNAVR